MRTFLSLKENELEAQTGFQMEVAIKACAISFVINVSSAMYFKLHVLLQDIWSEIGFFFFAFFAP